MSDFVAFLLCGLLIFIIFFLIPLIIDLVEMNKYPQRYKERKAKEEEERNKGYWYIENSGFPFFKQTKRYIPPRKKTNNDVKSTINYKNYTPPKE